MTLKKFCNGVGIVFAALWKTGSNLIFVIINLWNAGCKVIITLFLWSQELFKFVRNEKINYAMNKQDLVRGVHSAHIKNMNNDPQGRLDLELLRVKYGQYRVNEVLKMVQKWTYAKGATIHGRTH